MILYKTHKLPKTHDSKGDTSIKLSFLSGYCNVANSNFFQSENCLGKSCVQIYKFLSATEYLYII